MTTSWNTGTWSAFRITRCFPFRNSKLRFLHRSVGFMSFKIDFVEMTSVFWLLSFLSSLYDDGAFTLRGTQTDTDTDKMGAESNGNLCWYLSLCSMNTFTQIYAGRFYWCLYRFACSGWDHSLPSELEFCSLNMLSGVNNTANGRKNLYLKYFSSLREAELNIFTADENACGANEPLYTRSKSRASSSTGDRSDVSFV